MTNIIEIRIRATDETGPVYDAVKARSAEAGAEAGAAFTSAYATHLRGEGGDDITSAGDDLADRLSTSVGSGMEDAARTEGAAIGEQYGDAFGQQASMSIEEALSSSTIAPNRVTSARKSPFANMGPTPEDIAEQRAQLAALQQEMEQGGEDAGAALAAGMGDSLGRDLPHEVEDPIKQSGSSAGSAFSAAFQGDLEQGLSTSALSGIGHGEGEKFSVSFGQGAKDAMQGATLSGILGGLEDAPVADVLDPSGPAATKLKTDAKTTGEQAGKDMGGGMSPLIVSALVGAAAVGAPLLLAGLGTAFVGVAALALKSNKVIAADYSQLGKDAENAFKQAAAPLAGTMHQALVGMEGDVSALEPALQGLFTDAEPDITAVASGVDAFAKGILPGMSAAIKGSQGIVADFGASMGPLGQNVGGFFQGLTRDAYTTGSGMESLLGAVGHLANTLGTVLGSAATVGSTALMGIDPVLNTTLSVVQKIANPATVGAAGGLFASFKLDPSIATGLSKAADGVSTLALKAMDAGGTFGKMGSALEGTASSLEKGASIMGGPWGMAVGAGIGLVTGLAGSLINASHASDALTLSQQSLDQAVQQDSGHIGSSVTSLVAAQAQTDGLAQSASAAGVSLATFTQAVIGNKAAQQDVTNAVEKTSAAQNQAGLTADQNTKVMGKYAQEQQDATTAAQGSAVATNRLSDSQKQLLASVSAQNAQITSAITKQEQLTAATNALSNATTIFNASVKAQYQTEIASAQQSALASVAAMNLGAANSSLSQKLYQTEIAYTLTTTAAQGYASVLQSLNGTADTLAQAQSTVDQQLLATKTSFQQGGTAITGMSQAAVTNRATLDQAASAIQALGVAQYQASGSIDKGNATIKQQISNFVAATGATGKAKQAIESYLQSLAKIPPNTSTTVHANTSQASLALNALLNQMDQIRNTGVNVAVQQTQRGYATGGVKGAATGGARGGLTMVGEAGPELVDMPYGSSVYPNSMMGSMMGGYGGGGGQVQVQFVGDTSNAFASFFMLMVRQGRIQIKQKAIVP